MPPSKLLPPFMSRHRSYDASSAYRQAERWLAYNMRGIGKSSGRQFHGRASYDRDWIWYRAEPIARFVPPHHHGPAVLIGASDAPSYGSERFRSRLRILAREWGIPAYDVTPSQLGKATI